MYWPLGTPRIYAAANGFTHVSRQAPPADRLSPPDDAAEQIPGRPALLSPTLAAGHDAFGAPPTPVTPVTPATPLTPAIRSIEHDYHDEVLPLQSPGPLPAGILPKEPILALKVARSGHLFVVVTSTTMAIWQTKV